MNHMNLDMTTHYEKGLGHCTRSIASQFSKITTFAASQIAEQDGDGKHTRVTFDSLFDLEIGFAKQASSGFR